MSLRLFELAKAYESWHANARSSRKRSVHKSFQSCTFFHHHACLSCDSKLSFIEALHPAGILENELWRSNFSRRIILERVYLRLFELTKTYEWYTNARSSRKRSVHKSFQSCTFLQILSRENLGNVQHSANTALSVPLLRTKKSNTSFVNVINVRLALNQQLRSTKCVISTLVLFENTL